MNYSSYHPWTPWHPQFYQQELTQYVFYYNYLCFFIAHESMNSLEKISFAFFLAPAVVYKHLLKWISYSRLNTKKHKNYISIEVKC